MQMKSDIKLGGEYRIKVFDQGQLIRSTGWFDNLILDSANTTLFNGFPAQTTKPIKLGISDTPVVASQLGVILPVTISDVSEVVNPTTSLVLQMTDPTNTRIVVNGSSTFTLTVDETGTMNEVGIDNFSRALVLDRNNQLQGIYLEAGNVIEVDYNFQLFYRLTEPTNLTIVGNADRITTGGDLQSGDIVLASNPMTYLPFQTNYKWDDLLSTMTTGYLLHSPFNGTILNISNADLVSIVEPVITGNNKQITFSFILDETNTTDVYGVYLGNKAFGVYYYFKDRVSEDTVGIRVAAASTISFDLQLDWVNT